MSEIIALEQDDFVHDLGQRTGEAANSSAASPRLASNTMPVSRTFAAEMCRVSAWMIRSKNSFRSGSARKMAGSAEVSSISEASLDQRLDELSARFRQS